VPITHRMTPAIVKSQVTCAIVKSQVTCAIVKIQVSHSKQLLNVSAGGFLQRLRTSAANETAMSRTVRSPAVRSDAFEQLIVRFVAAPQSAGTARSWAQALSSVMASAWVIASGLVLAISANK